MFIKKSCIAIFLSVFFITATHAHNAHFTIEQPKLNNTTITTDPAALLRAAQYALDYFFNSKKRRARQVTRSPLFENGLLSWTETKNTLEFIIKVIRQDLAQKRRKSRITDTTFLQKNFTFIRWKSDIAEANKNKVTLPRWFDKGKLVDGKIKLTGYAIFRCHGTTQKTRQRPHALYEIRSRRFDKLLRKRYEKKAILAGVLETPAFKRHVRPLVWLSRKDLEAAIMQGSMTVIMPNGTTRLFNVHKSNGFEYNKTIKQSYKQKKYWFFTEIKDKKKRKDRRLMDFTRLGGVAFAGDIAHLGLGKIIALNYKNPITHKNVIKLGVLADRGSAFSRNLYQLDLFTGNFDNRQAFNRYMRYLAPSAQAFILKQKK